MTTFMKETTTMTPLKLQHETRELTADEQKLLTILTYKRPHDDPFTNDFAEKFIGGAGATKVDSVGNYALMVMNEDGTEPETLFSCHYDTVHSKAGIQKVCYDPNLEMAYKDDDSPLGADDGAGVFLLLHMLKHGVPGLYIWHAGEEKGCVGSRYLSTLKPDWLVRIKRAIAFDRRDTTHIITHQGGERGCSEKFVNALAAELNKTGLKYKGDPTGLYTDTKEYFDIISECTNISVGYEGEHSKSETLDVGHIMKLAEVLVTIDFEKLPAERDHTAPAEYDDSMWGWGNRGGTSYGKRVSKDGSGFLGDYQELLDLCLNEPEIAAQLLVNCSVTDRDIADAREDYGYYSRLTETDDDDDDDRFHKWNLN